MGDNNIYIDFLFSYADSSDFYVGQSASIFINGFAGSTAGTVTAVSSGSTAPSNAAGSGRQMTAVRVKAVNPGLVTADYTASAVIGSYFSYGNSGEKVSQTSTITAPHLRQGHGPISETVIAKTAKADNHDIAPQPV